jgi:hypothetical protein
MTQLGRRRHSRYLLAQPVDGSLRVREEVAIEAWDEDEVVILSPEPCRPDERLTLEVPGDAQRRLAVRVSECRPAVAGDDGAIRHRLRLQIERHAAGLAKAGGIDT